MTGKPVQKMFLLAVLLAGLVASMASVAVAQDDGEVALPDGSPAPRNEGSLYSGAYEVTEDGDLIYGGDVQYECKDLVRFGAPATPNSEPVTWNGSVVEPLTREAVQLCTEAGFPPEGATPSAPGGPGSDALPETGGLTLLPALSFIVAAILGAGAPSALCAGHRLVTLTRRP